VFWKYFSIKIFNGVVFTFILLLISNFFGIISFIVTIWVYYFFRDPERFSINDNFSVPLKKARENFEKEYLTSQLKKFGGNISKTAKFVGMERSALHRKLKILGVKGLN